MTIDDWDNYANHAWGWDWLQGCFPHNRNVKPSDRDGFVHVEGQLLFLEGKVTVDLPSPKLPATSYASTYAPTPTAGNPNCSPTNRKR